MKRKLELTFVLLLMIGALIFSRRLSKMIAQEASGKIDSVDVIIDAGHGGTDPGKVGINQALEKDINFEIAKKLEKLLKEKNISCKMVRTEDRLLAQEGSKQKKIEDMKERDRIINEIRPSLAVSIHQNSYTEESIKGAQVFYYKHSKKGEELAKQMQEALKALDETNHREAKANETYYLLKKTEVPTIIVECGFLSNREEAEKLSGEEYQNEAAKAIAEGIEQCISLVKR